MEYVRLGSTGLLVSRFALGMMTFGSPDWRPYLLPEQEALRLVTRAVEGGVTFFDTADVYSQGVSEEITGRVLKKVFSRREEYVIATKVRGVMGPSPNDAGLSRGHILDGVDASLRRLGVDHIDLYQIHRWHRKTPIEETMEALHDCVRWGKVRYIGASSMFAWQFAKAQNVATVNGWTRFVTMQNQYNLLYREEEREMLPQCVDMGVGVLPWSPLARGRLSRPWDEAAATKRGESDEVASELYDTAERSIIDAVGQVSERHGVSRAKVALAWLLTKRAVTAPIVGVTKDQHVEEMLQTLEVRLTPEDLAELEADYRPREVLGQY
jgi:aryl-alcohol dehydrogenase-like predicted oxidoreductase